MPQRSEWAHEWAHLARLASCSFLSVFADRAGQFLLLSVVVMSGPGGEGTGSSSLALLLPAVLLGFACGGIVDRIGSRRATMLAAVARALILLATPALMIVTAGDRLAVSLEISFIGGFAVLSSLGRFAWAPLLVSAAKLQNANAVLWICTSLATVTAAFAVLLMPADLTPSAAFKVCSGLYFAAAIAAWAIKKQQNPESNQIPGIEAIKSVFDYLKLHRGARDVVRLTVLLSFVFLLGNVILLYVVAENYQPGGVDLHQLFAFAFGGCIVGAWLAPNASAISRPAALLCGTLCGVFVASLICLSANTLMIVKYALGLAGINSGMALVTLDTMLQRSIPARMRATVAGCRDAVVATLLLICVLAVEQSFEKVSLINVFRAIAMVQLLITALVFLLWPRFARFIFRILVWPLLASWASLRVDSPHHLNKTRASLFVGNQTSPVNAAIVCGAFATPTIFLTISNHPSLADRFMLRNVGGVVAASNAAAVETARAKLRRGYNVILMSDELVQEQGGLGKNITKLCSQFNYALIPCAINKDSSKRASLTLRCGVPLKMDRSATAKKLAAELKSLRAEAPTGGGAHVT